VSGYVDPTVAGAAPTGATSGTSPADSSLGELIGNVTRDLSTLMRQEVALAKAEISDSAKKAGKGSGMLAGAGVAGHFVLLFVSIALWWGLGDLMDNNTISAIIVAVLWGVVAAVLASQGRNELKKVQGVPQTQETVAEIPNALKGHEEENR
jgi:Putative Actinobacterial Holin-X, holin superfamily III